MKPMLALGLIAIGIAGTTTIAFSVFSIPESIQLTDIGPSDSVFVNTAHAGIALESRDVAKVMRVRISESGHNNELVLGSFSRIGFVSGGASFLLESLPSEDKKPFYRFVRDSLEAQRNGFTDPKFLDVKIDLFSGDYDLIQTLEYSKCYVFDYFVHAVDSRANIRFLEDGDQGIEIREVTKFSCQKFKIMIED
ncbi:MAG TPA: hypothetical protein VLC72_00480 [Nitrosopumilaceae archaeon]|nr:hypothetical protein [Nitrosopumilaceae archaeon]